MKELPKTYNPTEAERGIYSAWEHSGFFNPDNFKLKRTAPPFSIALPPPNTTAILHMGTAMMLSIEDALVRYHRMKGDRTLWLPGTDHAAIATQNIVEKQLLAEGTTKEALGRERFLKRVNEFVAATRGTITKQMKRLGASLDWSRERFTLDEPLSRAVRTMFTTMYQDGLVYRGDRIVNWCPRCQSTLADDEVDYRETTAPFYYLRYGPVTIATARPETKFQDKTIVVHPDDKRYEDLIGKRFTVDWIDGSVEARVIADPSADPNVGTGAMTLTPAHSFVDFELAKKYGLEIIQIIDESGRLTSAAGSFVGLPVDEARKWVVSQLSLKGLIDHIDENYVHNLSVCYRCGTPVEPLVSKQWFIDVRRPVVQHGGRLVSLKERALAAVTDGEIAMLPERFVATYRHWIENLRDWCISRQLWYGHRLPVWERRLPAALGSTWNFKLSGPDTLNAIASGRKRFETRAGKAKGAEKDWRRLNIGDRITFTAVNIKNESPLWLQAVTKRIASIRHFVSYDDLLRHVPLEQNEPGTTPESFVKKFDQFPGYPGRIQRYGLWVFELVDEQAEVNETYVGIEPPSDAQNWIQSSDTLDTWFSSGLWTFSTLGWPDQTADLKAFHPTSILETAYDILFFWVARMIILSTYALKQIPFKTVYLHGLVRDEQGRKMSKSLGNGIDPVDMIDRYGADATRLSLLIGTTPGNDVRLSERKVAGYRNFVNKLWNISRFALLQGAASSHTRPTPTSPADRWILSRLNRLVRDTSNHLDALRLSAAAEGVYAFAWHEFADWYLEIAKVEKNIPIVRHVLETTLTLLHPFVPFFTERVWREFHPDDDLLLVAPWPSPDARRISDSAEREFEKFRTLVQALRSFKARSGLQPAEAGSTADPIKPFALLSRLTGVRLQSKKAEGTSLVRFGPLTIYFPSERVSAFSAWREKERRDLTKRIEQKERALENSRLPDQVRTEVESQLQELRAILIDLTTITT